MAWVWTGMVVLSLVFGLLTGRLDAVANAALEGARSAIDLSISMAGILCLWSGVMEIMRACGLSSSLAQSFRPLLRRLLPMCPQTCWDWETLPHRLAFVPPSGWLAAAAAWPAMSCACWWC